MKQNTKAIATGGMLTALAVVVLNLGSIIPMSTYICPIFCIIMGKVVLTQCGKRIGWCFYLGVSILGMLMAADREAALVFVLLGYYPMLKPRLDLMPLNLLWKGLLFSAVGWVEFALALYVLGIGEAMDGLLGLATLALWVALCFMVDRLLGMKLRRR